MYISTKEMKNLSILQLKYLKRMLQVPSSTQNISVLLELGIKPVEQEIHIRQLGFLYHILSLEEDDPVRKVYQQQKLYHKEKNWYEARELLKKYSINKSEEEILTMGRHRWKTLVKTKVTAEIIDVMNKQRTTLAKSSRMPPYAALEIQEYFNFLSPGDAHLLFQIRVQVFDVKRWKKYRYAD